MNNPSEINIAETQVLFADLQKQIVARSKTTDPKALARSAAVLAQLAKVFSLPVTHTVVPEAGKEPELIPELAEEARNVPKLLRTGGSPFADLKTRSILEGNNRKTILLAGFATEVVVLHAVTGGIGLGYRVIVAVDACGGLSERTEAAAFRQIEAFGGEISSIVTMATALAPDFTTELGQQMFAVLQRLRLA